MAKAGREDMVRKAARAHYDAKERVKELLAQSQPSDPDERKALYEAIQVARYEAAVCESKLARAMYGF